MRTISRAEHRAFVAGRRSASPMQLPSWGELKSQWRSESIGWIDESGAVVGAGLVLYRQLPLLKRYLAYLPEGPVIDWFDPELDRRWLRPMLAHLKAQGAFSVKMGPQVALRRWEAATVKDAIAGGTARRLRDVEADWHEPQCFELVDGLRRAGWLRSEDGGAGFGDVQPRYVFQVPLAGRSLDDIQRGFNQLWRRNIKKAEKSGVEVVQGGYEDLAVFHRLYEVTAERDRFTPRPLAYFQRMWTALTAEDPNRMRLYIAYLDGEPLAATTMLAVGEHVWYSYGASADHRREVKPSNAIQWRMMRDAYALGASVYDLRGISDTLVPGDHLAGLLRFKVGTGGQAVEHLGEWDFPLNRLLHEALGRYLKRRR
ncbi:lipid II:glycine glycyltransferase FemX [Kitasatospora sp. NBC_01302]|uniref:lipid II:glycine glycyltransferase FemX n=1 Tax=Kitasatospora sp. NBC_01302 TaxID=2903575 RepID=UPI002E14011F|nr:aminoacyltransferase [Kitasatospora sp. NBC_01302]